MFSALIIPTITRASSAFDDDDLKQIVQNVILLSGTVVNIYSYTLLKCIGEAWFTKMHDSKQDKDVLEKIDDATKKVRSIRWIINKGGVLNIIPLIISDDLIQFNSLVTIGG
ncbi:hypothetical protein [Lactococcus protaetiae]|uniref:Uncharacterized protein n=1 Tax=Lactococcus protaetiae TaxID=2592653 RepID=A0A514Z9W4_9LACT|nr:hypothetical protein [Lactococcus protaetiae]QDK71371.1 hypothetical protein FLP15_09660 [Lactococcus protaetiae]